jgi:hypothetical protein
MRPASREHDVGMNEADTRYHLIDPVLRGKGYVSRDHITLETVLTPPPVEPSGPKGRRRRGAGRTDYLLRVQVGDAPRPLPVAVLEAKREDDDPLRGLQQARGYADTLRFDVKYVFSTNGHRYGEYDRFTELISGPRALADFPPHADLTVRFIRDTGIDLRQPAAAMLFQADSPAWSDSRYYQDAAIRAAFEKILLDQQAGRRACCCRWPPAPARPSSPPTCCGGWRRPGSCPGPRCSCAIATSCASRPTASSRPLSATTPASSGPSVAPTRRPTPASTSPPTRRWAWTTTRASPAS